MAKNKKRYWLIPGILVFLAYVLLAAQPVPEETVLVPRWLSSLETNFQASLGGSAPEAAALIPFRLGNRFGYISDSGQFINNRILEQGYLSFSPERWSEYDTQPASIQVFDPAGREQMTIENPRGYPLFLDNRTFIIGNEQNSVSAIDNSGNIQWTYDFSSPLTCIDAAAGFILAGTLDGVVELLDSQGSQVFSFEPGGSRLAIILGCAISQDGTRFAVISGIDNQRFLMLERTGDSYRVAYHEFLSNGYRRAVHIRFIDNDSRIVFEREGGIGIYTIAARTNLFIGLEGEVIALDAGDNKYFFIVISQEENKKRLIGIKLPDIIVLNAPFRSENAFLGRRNSRLYIGGDLSLASFELGKK
ncbi:MAG: WD40 repeat domain-containing protein [Treponema sp.]|nr:WD40 repeat domain-containing protein [Treponema sp.]